VAPPLGHPVVSCSFQADPRCDTGAESDVHECLVKLLLFASLAAVVGRVASTWV